jgi:hypothetical protein
LFIVQIAAAAEDAGFKNNILSSFPVPPNDDCANALELIPNNGRTDTDNFNNVVNGPIPSCGGGVINDVWYFFTYTGGDAQVWFDNLSIFKGRLVVYDACNGNQIACTAFGTFSL